MSTVLHVKVLKGVLSTANHQLRKAKTFDLRVVEMKDSKSHDIVYDLLNGTGLVSSL